MTSDGPIPETADMEPDELLEPDAPAPATAPIAGPTARHRDARPRRRRRRRAAAPRRPSPG